MPLYFTTYWNDLSFTFQEAISSAGYPLIMYSIDIIEQKGVHLEDAIIRSLVDNVGIEVFKFPESFITIQTS